MKIFLRLILISMLSFMYADEDCSLVTDQATCEADDHCVWDDTDGLCEDAEGDHDDHDHGDEEHCEDLVDESSCIADDHCEWHADEMACEDAGDDHDDHDHGN